MKRSIVGLCFVLLSSLAWALPTVQQVETEVQKGNYTQAETMMGEVVAAKPDSARAHYTYAEILAHNASFAKASDEVAKARKLDPQLTFTSPDKFRAFEALLQREQNPPSRSRATSPAPAATPSSSAMTTSSAMAPEARSGIPGWVWLVGLIALGAVMWRMFARGRGPVPAAAGAAGVPGTAAGYAPAGMPSTAYGPGGGMNAGMPYGNNGMPQQQGAGGGLLRTGLAVGAGVAGGMLIDEMMHRRSGNEGGHAGALGGFDPNSYDPAADSAARDLESRPIDFGQGGDNWDSGGGSSDGGSDGGGGGGWD